MDKTVVVQVERVARHSRYGKVLRVRKKYKAHDEQNGCHVGDLVRIVESRPLSREKRWQVEEIVKHAEELPELAPGVLEVEQ
ncbi:MAG: 30S ribosomal protein S17 [Anaerolineae bacterium]|nr:30S ribosomal protein S17 [Anaerolineae bacterium]